MSITTEDRTQNGAAPPLETQLALKDQVGEVKTGLVERIHALEVAQATQTATTAGMQATQAASMAGAQATQAAVQAGMMSTVMAGAVSFIVGGILGALVTRARR